MNSKVLRASDLSLKLVMKKADCLGSMRTDPTLVKSSRKKTPTNRNSPYKIRIFESYASIYY